MSEYLFHSSSTREYFTPTWSSSCIKAPKNFFLSSSFSACRSTLLF